MIWKKKSPFPKAHQVPAAFNWRVSGDISGPNHNTEHYSSNAIASCCVAQASLGVTHLPASTPRVLELYYAQQKQISFEAYFFLLGLSV